jgi:hypothetical protein
MALNKESTILSLKHNSVCGNTKYPQMVVIQDAFLYEIYRLHCCRNIFNSANKIMYTQINQHVFTNEKLMKQIKSKYCTFNPTYQERWALAFPSNE